MSMKNSNDTIGNRTRQLPACCAVCYAEAKYGNVINLEPVYEEA
jgi:hypothetical protein